MESSQNQISSLNSYSLKEFSINFANAHSDYLYLIGTTNTKKPNLFIYNTKSEKEDVIRLDSPKVLEVIYCIVSLPNDELFCFGKERYSTFFAFKIAKNYKMHVLPSGIPCCYPSVVYFDRNVYCFGGFDYRGNFFTQSIRIDLDKNRWSNLVPMPWVDKLVYSIVFNRNILISGYYYENLLLYSIDIDSFSILPYSFENYQKRILLNAEEKLLLIDSEGWIYESEDAYSWNVVTNLEAKYHPQVYCLYNQGWIYCGSLKFDHKWYFKFNLEKRILLTLSEVSIKT